MKREAIVGAILGGAIGDGWRTQHEGSVTPGGARFPEELVITDDTQLTLATREAIVAAG